MLLNTRLTASQLGNKHNTIRSIAQRLSGFGWRFFTSSFWRFYGSSLNFVHEKQYRSITMLSPTCRDMPSACETTLIHGALARA